jgi:hypothetical protein
MLARLANPYWSPDHPTKYALNCEGEFGPGAEFKTNSQFRPAWNIFWAMSHQLNTPKQVAELNIDLMHKVIEDAIAVSRVNLTLDGVRFSLAQLSLLMGHQEFVELMARELNQLHTERSRELLDGLEPSSLLTAMGRRLLTEKDESEQP